jgi:molybdenum cofactor synthesis domain-containing protein
MYQTMKQKSKKINASILIIGNEILSGRTQDLNVAFITNWLNLKCGISVAEVRIIPDVEKVIIKNILELNKKFKYVFTTGGIGPTHDDITAQSISKAFKVKYEYHKEAYSILEKYYGKIKFNDGRKKMAKMPKGAKLIYNPSSTAPGFIIKNIFSLPGVPSILQGMIHNCKKYLIRGDVTISTSFNLQTVESNIAKELGNIQKKYIKDIEIGSYPFFRLGIVGVSIILRSSNKNKILKCKIDIKSLIKKKKIKLFSI